MENNGEEEDCSEDEEVDPRVKVKGPLPCLFFSQHQLQGRHNL